MGSSSQPDRSLGSGLSFPQWMKGKIDTRWDFDDTAFSPPSHDDSFFFVRYPKKQEPTPATQGMRSITDVLNESNMTVSSNQVTDNQPTSSSFKKPNEIDFSKHPLPCQPFIPSANRQGSQMKTMEPGKIKTIKSQGTDDGFHSEPALCGRSIVHVAKQMMSKNLIKGSIVEQDEVKKGSRSLPVTPLTSPKTSPDNSPKARRKAHSTNRYFTGTFAQDRDKYHGGWILSSILGQSREIVSSKIVEEDERIEIVPPKTLSRKKSISSQNLTYIGDDNNPSPSIVQANILKAKPSELREMNFWSPTSM